MTCSDALQAILEADPAELEGPGSGSLAAHLRGCRRCRSMARAILADEALLAQGLVTSVPLLDLDRLLDEALGAAPVSEIVMVESTPSEKPRSFSWRRAAATLLPLAAAATLAALFLGRSPQLPGDPYQPAPEVPGLGLEVPEGRNVAVLATNNPDITILWFF